MNNDLDRSPRKSFSRADDYSQLQSGAHRKPATPIGVPSLVAHLGFWQRVDGPKSEDHPNIGREGSPIDLRNASWSTRVDKYIRAIYCVTKDKGFDTQNAERGTVKGSKYIFLFDNAIDITESPRFELRAPVEIGKDKSIDEYFNTRNQSVVFSFVWHFIRVMLRFEKHQEFLTITAFLDLSVVPTKDNAAGSEPIGDEVVMGDPIFRNLEQNIIDLAKDLEDYRKFLDEDPHRPGHNINQDQKKNRFWEHHKALYTEIWSEFTKEILLSSTPLVAVGTDISGTVADYGRYLGKVFADFKGLVLGPTHPNPLLANPNLKDGATADFQLPRWRRLEVTQEKWLGERMAQTSALSRTEQLWPFVTSEQLVPLRRKEFTANRMLDGHALYISALGAQPSPYGGIAADRETEQFPVYYLFFVTTFSQWQIGRLIERINSLGTLRIAALHELKPLYDVGNKLRELHVPLDAAGLEQTQATIIGWNEDFSGGLNYRIERSRYYVKQFVTGIEQLRIRRVEGYQPYDLFVLRRLSSTFDFIDRLGVRLDRYRSQLETRAQSLTANTLVGLQTIQQGLLANANRHLETAEANTAKLDRHANRLVKLQQVGEAFLWCVLAPYYISGYFEHILERVESGWFGVVIAGLYIAIGVVLICVGVQRYRDLSQELDGSQVQEGSTGIVSLWRRIAGLWERGRPKARLAKPPAPTPATMPGSVDRTKVETFDK